MSGPIKTALQKQYKAAFVRWPKDQLRPDLQLQELLNHDLAERIAGRTTQPFASNIKNTTNPVSTGLQQLRQVNALFSLLDNRYQTTYPLNGPLMKPKSNPTYYADLIIELEEAPQRSFLGRVKKRLGGMFRFS